MQNTLCVCGHERDAHEHYRRGTDCATCGPEQCSRFRRALVQRKQPPTSPPTSSEPATERKAGDRATLVAAMTGPLATVSHLRAHAARRLDPL